MASDFTRLRRPARFACFHGESTIGVLLCLTCDRPQHRFGRQVLHHDSFRFTGAGGFHRCRVVHFLLTSLYFFRKQIMMDQLTHALVLEQYAASDEGNTRWRDSIGMVASIGCAVHCAAMPFVVASLPAFGLSFLAHESFHRWMAIICFAIAISAFVPGWLKHRRLLPASLACVGLSLIGSAAFGLAGDCCTECALHNESMDVLPAAACTAACCEYTAAEHESAALEVGSTGASPSPAGVVPSLWLSRVAPWLTPLGGLILVSAHILNRRFGCLCGCCSRPE